jgi:hypothetical protein
MMLPRDFEFDRMGDEEQGPCELGSRTSSVPLDDRACQTFQKAGSRNLALTSDSPAFDNENLERMSYVLN